MAAVFDGKTKIGRAVPETGIDDILPPQGSLMLGAITTPAALAGTVGTEALLVHGAVWRDISDMQTENLRGDILTMILGNETHTVAKNQTLSVTQTVNQTITQNYNFTVIGAQNNVRVGPQNSTFAAPDAEHKEGDAFESKLTNMEHIALFEFAANTGLKTEITNLSIGLGNTSFEVKVLKGEALIFKTASEGIEEKMQGLANRLAGVQAKAGGAEAKAQPDANAAPGVSPVGLAR